MHSTEDHTGAQQLLRGVCDVLDRMGFRMRDGGLGLTVESTSEGVKVIWRRGHTPLRAATRLVPTGTGGASDGGYGRGANAAVVAAVAAVLEAAGYQVRRENFGLLVTADPR